MSNANEDSSGFSYRALRLAIGVLGLSLPFLLLLGTWFQNVTSVSDYYYTNMRDWLVGVLFFLTLFLAFYRPYRRVEKNEGVWDRVIAIVSSVSAGLLALFPTYNQTLGHVPDHNIVLNFVSGFWSGQLHNIGSGVLFTAFAAMSIFIFTQTGLDKNGKRIKATGRKLLRNVLYIVFGVGILACIVTIGLLALTAGSQAAIDRLVIFPLETTALILFGLSWLVKGAAFPFLND